MKKLFGIILLVLLLVSCRPPVVDPVNPIPPDPTPVFETSDISGTWRGALRSDENFFVIVSVQLEELTDGKITGQMVFVDEPVETVGAVTGTVVGNNLADFVVVVTDGRETIIFVMTGVFNTGMFTGTFSGLLDSKGAFILVRVE
jgi:hypothetical protein